jgi:hypothetical protein
MSVKLSKSKLKKKYQLITQIYWGGTIKRKGKGPNNDLSTRTKSRWLLKAEKLINP